MGTLAFFIFIKNEQKLEIKKKEKAEDQKKIDQAIKDLVESYNYIGEVNRKMDILMNVAFGLSDQTSLSKSQEDEAYASIISAANFIFKAESTCLRLIDTTNGKTKKELCSEGKRVSIKNSDLIQNKGNTNIKKDGECLIAISKQESKNVRCYLIIRGYDKTEESNPKNTQILKVLSSQALFLYSYTHKQQS